VTQRLTGSFLLAIIVGMIVAAAVGLLLEQVVLRRFYGRNHLDQVLATFGLILIMNEATRIIFGSTPLRMSLPDNLSGSVHILPGVPYPVFRLVILGVGLAVAGALYLIIMKTRMGMWVRAGASNRAIAAAMGVNVPLVFAGLFAVGAAFAGLAGIMAGPIPRAHSHSRAGRHRHRRHRLHSRRVHRRADGRRRRHVRPRAADAGARLDGNLHADGGDPRLPPERIVRGSWLIFPQLPARRATGSPRRS